MILVIFEKIVFTAICTFGFIISGFCVWCNIFCPKKIKEELYDIIDNKFLRMMAHLGILCIFIIAIGMLLYIPSMWFQTMFVLEW